jgi:hypothetical protein
MSTAYSSCMTGLASKDSQRCAVPRVDIEQGQVKRPVLGRHHAMRVGRVPAKAFYAPGRLAFVALPQAPTNP